MGFWSELFGIGQREPAPHERVPRRRLTDDEYALDRYRYLLRTAPPERLEQVHAEAFARLTPHQRQLLLDQMHTELPAEEVPHSAEPSALARAATRAEVQQPGSMERLMAAPSLGSMFASSMLGSVTGYVLASALMSSFLPSHYGELGEGMAGDPGTGTGVGEASAVEDVGGGGLFDVTGGDFGGLGDFGGFDF